MEPTALFLLALSIVCSTARAVFSKKLGALSGSRRGFYLTQAVLFAVAAAVLLMLNVRSIARPSQTAVLLAVAYGVLTVLSQWMYTLSLTRCPVSVCAMVYSFGFILPTVFGTVVWREPVNAFKIVSILLCIGTIFLASGKSDAGAAKPRGLPLPLIVAMLASGGLGIVQKLQQKSAASGETGMFLCLAFVLATLLSLLAALAARKDAAPKARIAPALALPILIFIGASCTRHPLENQIDAARDARDKQASSTAIQRRTEPIFAGMYDSLLTAMLPSIFPISMVFLYVKI